MATSTQAMTWRQLKEQVAALTEAQLDMKVMWAGEEIGGFVVKVEVLTEDHINPSGEALEPRSFYGSEADDEPVVAPEGQPILHVDEWFED